MSCNSHSFFSRVLFITSFSNGIIIQVPSSFMPLLLIHPMNWHKSSVVFAVSVLYPVLYAAEGILVLAFYWSDSFHYQHFSCVFLFCSAAFSLLVADVGDNSQFCDTSKQYSFLKVKNVVSNTNCTDLHSVCCINNWGKPVIEI